MTVKRFLESTFKDDPYNTRDRALCADGFSISIQGGTSYHYCTPRTLCNVYEDVELGYPSEFDFLLSGLGEDGDTCETVFPHVPISIVEELSFSHGGIIRSQSVGEYRKSLSS